MSTLVLNINLRSEEVLNAGIRDVLSGIQLEPKGKVVVPINLDGMIIRNPMSCGTWEIVDD